VRETIERDGSIKLGLARGLINARALARYIQVATHERYSFEALVSAIRRYPVKETAARRLDVSRVIRKLSMKNKVSVILMRNRPELQPILARFTGELDHASGETLRVVSTTKTVKVVIDSRNEDRLTSKLQKRDILQKMDNLAEIAVDMSDILHVPGVFSAIVTELAMNGVNILEASGAEQPLDTGREQQEAKFLSQLYFVVDERDGMKAYQALQRLSEEK
jgi:aspartokinase